MNADATLQNFLNNLKQRGLLAHAIVVLLSDHGITLALPGDRNTVEALYQGNKNKILLKRTHYITVKNFNPQHLKIENGTQFNLTSQSGPPSILNPSNYGIDTSFGYGGDVLSLKQNHALLAFRGYGINIGTPHAVAGRSFFLDIAPTLLDLVNLPALPQAEGLSLKAYFYDSTSAISNERSVIFESAFSEPEIEHEGILLGGVVTKNFSVFEIDPHSGLVSITSKAANELLTHKQRAIMQGDWFLAYYPASMRYKKILTSSSIKTTTKLEFKKYLAPPYAVLLNLKTGLWTSEMHNTFAASAPLASLNQQLNAFYGDEMRSYAAVAT